MFFCSRTQTEKYQITTEESASEFAKTSGKYLVTYLNLSLNELQNKDPSIVWDAAADSALAFEALVKANTNAK